MASIIDENLGMWSGLAQGAQGFLTGYKDARKMKRDEDQLELEKVLKQKQMALSEKQYGAGLAEHGLVEGTDGKFTYTPEKAHEKEVEQGSKIGGLLKEGVRPTQGFLGEQAKGFEQYVTPEQQAKLEEADKRLKAMGVREEKKGKQESFKNVQSLRHEYTSHPTTKSTQIITDAYKKIQGAAKSQTAASDMSLIFGIMKMQDPNSTVREGEYASAENARGVAGTISNLYNKVKDGVRLTPQQRQDFLNQAQTMFGSQMQNQKELDDYYTGLANDEGYDPKKVLVQFGASNQGLLKPESGGGKAAVAPEDEEAISWAKSNRGNPDAEQILKLHGIK